MQKTENVPSETDDLVKQISNQNAQALSCYL